MRATVPVPTWIGRRRAVRPPATRARGDADDVDDGVEGADLVELDVLRIDAVDGALDLGEAPNVARARSRTRSAGRPRSGASISRQVRRGRGPPSATTTAGSRTTAAPRRRRRATTPGTASPPIAAAPSAKVGAGVEEGAEQHVAGDAGEGVHPRSLP